MTQFILSNKEMAKAALLTIESGISSLDLMFNAGKKVFNNLPIKKGKRALFICGPGNNGGDGYVAADLLLKKGMEIDIYCPISKARESNDNLYYKQKLNNSLFVSKIKSISNYIQSNNLNVKIEVDGGVNYETGKLCIAVSYTHLTLPTSDLV